MLADGFGEGDGFEGGMWVGDADGFGERNGFGDGDGLGKQTDYFFLNFMGFCFDGTV